MRACAASRCSPHPLYEDSAMNRNATLVVAALLMGAVIGCNQTQTSKTTTTTTSTGATATATDTATTPPPANAGSTMPGTPTSGAKEVSMPSGLKYTDLRVGDGEIAQPN